MSAPAELAYEEVIQGTSWKPTYTLTVGGVPVNLAASGADAILRLLPVGGGTAIVKKLSGTAEAAFVTDGTDGQVQFVFHPDDTLALAVGWYWVEILSEGTNPESEVAHARGAIQVTVPVTGAY